MSAMSELDTIRQHNHRRPVGTVVALLTCQGCHDLASRPHPTEFHSDEIMADVWRGWNFTAQWQATDVLDGRPRCSACCAPLLRRAFHVVAVKREPVYLTNTCPTCHGPMLGAHHHEPAGD